MLSTVAALFLHTSYSMHTLYHISRYVSFYFVFSFVLLLSNFFYCFFMQFILCFSFIHLCIHFLCSHERKIGLSKALVLASVNYAERSNGRQTSMNEHHCNICVLYNKHVLIPFTGAKKSKNKLVQHHSTCDHTHNCFILFHRMNRFVKFVFRMFFCLF